MYLAQVAVIDKSSCDRLVTEQTVTETEIVTDRLESVTF